jgi:ATP-dependent RNA helicase SUPV3L1/SUV3
VLGTKEASALDALADAPSPPPVAAEVSGQTNNDAADATAKPQVIEVWRPGRSEGRRRPEGRQRQAGRHFGQRAAAPTQETAAPAVASEGTAQASPAEQTISATQPAPADRPASPEASKSGRHSRHGRRREADQRFDRPRRERERTPAPGARHERREKAPDPNSPFAKLAALKAQLEAEAKERR